MNRLDFLKEETVIAAVAYRPEFVHVTLKNLTEGMIPPASIGEEIKTQKKYYHHYIYVDNIIRNLRINQLICEGQKMKINVHYNFLSKFVHPGIASIEVWENINRISTPFSLTNQYDDEVYEELIFLYVARLMHLFLKIYVTHYGGGAMLVDDLDELSKDLWFFENEPTDFDRQLSARRYGNKETKDIRYYDDPLRGLHYRRKHYQNLRLSEF